VTGDLLLAVPPYDVWVSFEQRHRGGDGREPRRELPSHISGAQTVATDALRIADDLVKGALEAFHE
jgi:hypothetical protein